MKRKKKEPIFEVIGGTKKWRESLKKKITKELDPKSIHECNNRRTQS